MNVYVYQAALLCEDCGVQTRNKLIHEGNGPDCDDEQTYDSNDYPKGPYQDGGGESDTPNHCDMCHAFLENPLTTDGYAYMLDAVAEALRVPKQQRDAVREWWSFYKGDITL